MKIKLKLISLLLTSAFAASMMTYCKESEKYHVSEAITVRIKNNDEIYDGIYKIVSVDSISKMSPDALANQYFQQNSKKVY